LPKAGWKIAATILIHQREMTKKPDSTSATSILTLMATIRNTTVLMTERKKIGSSTSFT